MSYLLITFALLMAGILLPLGAVLGLIFLFKLTLWWLDRSATETKDDSSTG